MKKLQVIMALLMATTMTFADEKLPDNSEFSISSRAGNVSATLDGPEVFTRPVIFYLPDLTCSGTGSILSGVGTEVFYDVYEIHTPIGENLVATITSGFDSYLILYCDPFNPLAPLANLRFGDDDDGADMNSAFLPGDNAYLEPNTTYVLVVTSFSNGVYGDYTLSFEGSVVLGKARCDGTIGLVGEFNNWGIGNDDFLLARDPENPELWTGIIELTKDMNLYDDPAIIEMKFRLDADWTINWGAVDFPSGTAYQDGPNIPVPIDLNVPKEPYYVTFNCNTGEYTFSNLRFIPISDWAIYIGIMLMLTFVIIRFKRAF